MVRIKIVFPDEKDNFNFEQRQFDYDDGLTFTVAPRTVFDPQIKPPADIPVVSVYKDDCNFALSFRANIGGYQLPGYDIIHRMPDCRNESGYKPPEYKKEGKPQIPLNDGLSYVIINDEQIHYEQARRAYPTFPPQGWTNYERRSRLISSEIPYKQGTFIGQNGKEYSAYAKLVIKTSSIASFNGSFFIQNMVPVGVDMADVADRLAARGYDIELADGYDGSDTTYTKKTTETRTEYLQHNQSQVLDAKIFYGYKQDLEKFLDDESYLNKDDVITSSIEYSTRSEDRLPMYVPGKVPGYITLDHIDNDFYGLRYIGIGQGLHVKRDKQIYRIYPGDFNGDFVPPPPPPPEMSCCPDYSDLLKTLLKKVDKLSEIVGIDEYPAKLPQSLIMENGKEKGTENVPNLTRLLEWYIKRFDELMGQFEIAIDVDDTDLTKEGKQKQTIRLPNISETLAEVVSLLFQSTINTDLLVNMCTRVLAETGADKQQNFKTHQAVYTIIDFLGYNYKEDTVDMPLTFKPDAKTFDTLLKDGDIKVKTIKYDEKDNFHHHLHELLQAAAIIRAVHWRQVNPKGDARQQILNNILKQNKLKNEVNKVDNEELKALIKELIKTTPDEPDTKNH